MGRFVGRSALVTGLLALFLVGDPALASEEYAEHEAGRTYDNRDLRGDYLFSIVEVRRVQLSPSGSALGHCVIAGTVSFDGVGLATIDGTARCVVAGTTETGSITQDQYYAVNPDGSFLISESPSMTDPVHGQIVHHGRGLLLDGTTRTLAEVLSWSGVAMRR